MRSKQGGDRKFRWAESGDHLAGDRRFVLGRLKADEMNVEAGFVCKLRSKGDDGGWDASSAPGKTRTDQCGFERTDHSGNQLSPEREQTFGMGSEGPP